jgi:large subunit ribosomal protein L10
MLKAQKVTLVEELTKEIADAKSLVLVNYAGLNVKAQQELKKRLNAVGARMVVVKNTLLKRAVESAKIDSQTATDEILSGQTALVISGAIQILGKFSKEFVSEAGLPVPKFKVGVVEGSFQDGTNLSKLSTLPSRDILLGQVLGGLMSTMYGLVGTLQSPMSQLVYTLQNVRKSANSENSADQKV